MVKLEITEEDVKEQLLDVTVVIGAYELAEKGKPYVSTRIVRLDVEGASVEQFLQDLVNCDGVIDHHDVVAKE